MTWRAARQRASGSQQSLGERRFAGTVVAYESDISNFGRVVLHLVFPPLYRAKPARNAECTTVGGGLAQGCTTDGIPLGRRRESDVLCKLGCRSAHLRTTSSAPLEASAEAQTAPAEPKQQRVQEKPSGRTPAGEAQPEKPSRTSPVGLAQRAANQLGGVLIAAMAGSYSCRMR